MTVSSASDPTMLAVGAAKRAFIAAVNEQLSKAHATFASTGIIDELSIGDTDLAREGELQDALVELACRYRAFRSISTELERQRRDANECYFEQIAFDEALELLALTKRVQQSASQLDDTLQSTLARIVDCEQAEALLNRLFPIVSCMETYALRFVASHRFVENGAFVNCAEDMCASNGRFRFVPTPDTAAIGGNTVSLGQATKFGLQSYAWRQKENRFVCEQVTNHHLQSRTWLLADEEWVALSPFRSIEYARPLRVGDVFVLRSVGQRTTNQKFMTSLAGSDHLVLRNSVSASSYVMVLSDPLGRFLYEP